MARWTPGPFDGVDGDGSERANRHQSDKSVGRILSDAEGGSPGTPPHDDEPPRETPPPPAPPPPPAAAPPLAPEDARKLELAAAIFGESLLEVDLDALGRGKEAATDSEFDDDSEEDVPLAQRVGCAALAQHVALPRLIQTSATHSCCLAVLQRSII